MVDVRLACLIGGIVEQNNGFDGSSRHADLLAFTKRFTPLIVVKNFETKTATEQALGSKSVHRITVCTKLGFCFRIEYSADVLQIARS